MTRTSRAIQARAGCWPDLRLLRAAEQPQFILDDGKILPPLLVAGIGLQQFCCDVPACLILRLRAEKIASDVSRVSSRSWQLDKSRCQVWLAGSAAASCAAMSTQAWYQQGIPWLLPPGLLPLIVELPGDICPPAISTLDPHPRLAFHKGDYATSIVKACLWRLLVSQNASHYHHKLYHVGDVYICVQRRPI